jgi:hypothetical protein
MHRKKAGRTHGFGPMQSVCLLGAACFCLVGLKLMWTSHVRPALHVLVAEALAPVVSGVLRPFDFAAMAPLPGNDGERSDHAEPELDDQSPEVELPEEPEKSNSRRTSGADLERVAAERKRNEEPTERTKP